MACGAQARGALWVWGEGCPFSRLEEEGAGPGAGVRLSQAAGGKCQLSQAPGSSGHRPAADPGPAQPGGGRCRAGCLRFAFWLLSPHFSILWSLVPASLLCPLSYPFCFSLLLLFFFFMSVPLCIFLDFFYLLTVYAIPLRALVLNVLFNFFPPFPVALLLLGFS